MSLSYSEALKVGAKTYFTGIPCKNGHITERYTKGSTCVECAKQSARRRQQRNPQAYRAYLRVYYQNNRDRLLAQQKEYNRNNPEAQRQRNTSHRERNRAAYRESRRRYQAQKLQALPKWTDKDTLLRIYQDCPEGMQVDHIYPLQGKWVCGLHVPENLQYLTPEQNQRKGNR